VRAGADSRSARWRHDEAGGILVMSAFILMLMIGMAAFVLDLGFMRHDKRASQSAADMASVAGAMELRPTATSNGLAACEAAWAYVVENTAMPANSPSPCVPAAVGNFGQPCNADDPQPNVAVGEVAPYVVTITWPVLDDLLQGRDEEGDGEPCERIAVQIQRQRGFLLTGQWGISEGFTTAPAVARYAERGNDEIIASLIVLHREDCSTLTASGQGKIWVRATEEEPGIIVVDSAGSAGPGDCHNSNPFVIDPGTSNNTQIRAGVDASGNVIDGRIWSWTLAAGTVKSRAFRPNTFPRLAPTPTRAPRRWTRAIGDHEFNCKGSYPASFDIEPCEDTDTKDPYIDRLRTGIGTVPGAEPPVAASGIGEYENLVFRRYTEFANATYAGPGFNPCNMSSSDPIITLPTGPGWNGWWIDCPTWSINNTVVVEGGHIVTDGAVSLGSHGKLYTNQVRNPGPPVTFQLQDTDAFLFVRAGNLSKGSQATLSLHRTAVYLDNGATALGGGDNHASLRWTAPEEGDLSKLALWSESTATHSIGGQGNLTIEGVYFVPRATFSMSGQGNQVQEARAQFIASKLQVGGQGTIMLFPDPDFGIPSPVFGPTLIR
jgi:Flp pilus assembly protein TadG